MTKAELKMLEKLYAAEVEAAVSHQPLRGIVQTRSKTILALQKQGYAREVEMTVGIRPPLTVKGWELTLEGNFAYCMTCTHDGDTSV